MLWAAPQDWMCEPSMLRSTGLSVADHQRLTVENLLDLRSLDPTLPVVPVLQGWIADDYLRHVDQYLAAGVDLTAEPLVGMGSICRREKFEGISELFVRLFDDGLALHGFGLKAEAVKDYGWALASADSMAWSLRARRAGEPLCGTTHRAKRCHHCRIWAQIWADRVMTPRPETAEQLELW